MLYLGNIDWRALPIRPCPCTHRTAALHEAERELPSDRQKRTCESVALLVYSPTKRCVRELIDCMKVLFCNDHAFFLGIFVGCPGVRCLWRSYLTKTPPVIYGSSRPMSASITPPISFSGTEVDNEKGLVCGSDAIDISLRKYSQIVTSTGVTVH